MVELTTILSPEYQARMLENIPAISADSPDPSRSERYLFLPTHQIVTTFQDAGWKIRQTSQVKARVSRIDTVPHVIKFIHPDFKLEKGTVFPEISIRNSHNGQTPLEIMFGLFKLICTNGMVSQVSRGFDGRIRHTMPWAERFQHTMESFQSFLPSLANNVERMQNRVLSNNEQVNFAVKAFQLRNPKSLNTDLALSLLQVRREEDKGNNLWKVFNRVQENIHVGDYKISTPENKIRKARTLKPHRDLDFQISLWNLASSYMDMEAPAIN